MRKRYPRKPHVPRDENGEVNVREFLKATCKPPKPKKIGRPKKVVRGPYGPRKPKPIVVE